MSHKPSDLFSSNLTSGLDLDKLYQMPSPHQQHQKNQHDEFMAKITTQQPAWIHHEDNKSVPVGNPFIVPRRSAPPPPSPSTTTSSKRPSSEFFESSSVSKDPSSSFVHTSSEYFEYSGNGITQERVTEKNKLDEVKRSHDEKLRLKDSTDQSEKDNSWLDSKIKVKDGDKEIVVNEKDGSVVWPGVKTVEPEKPKKAGLLAKIREGMSIVTNSEILVGEETDGEEQGRSTNEQRFMGEGQTFRGKLIGVLEVPEARGDQMCQDALKELKMAVKASGEHKQRVVMHIAIDGLKIRDDKTGDCLYHHPVHKISFIAQDVSDNRAFGYIYGSPENSHRFFGIKTEKAAGQVVVTIRDLFQVVFDLKKKEIEEAKSQLGKEREQLQKSLGAMPCQPQPDVLQTAASFPNQQNYRRQNDGSFSDLLGLESELSNIQAGIQQIDKITPGTAPTSFHTDSMFPVGSGLPSHSYITQQGTCTQQQQSQQQQSQQQQQQQQQQLQQSQRHFPAAIVNTGQIKSDSLGSAPFLPPPPSKTMRQRSQEAISQALAATYSSQQTTDAFGHAAFPPASGFGSHWNPSTSGTVAHQNIDASGGSQASDGRVITNYDFRSNYFTQSMPEDSAACQQKMQKEDNNNQRAKMSMAEMASRGSRSQEGSMDALSNVGCPEGSHFVQPSLNTNMSSTLGRPHFYNRPPFVSYSREETFSIASDPCHPPTHIVQPHGFAHLSSQSQMHTNWQREAESRVRHYSAGKVTSGYLTTGRPGLRYCAIPTVPQTCSSYKEQASNSALKVSLPPDSNGLVTDTISSFHSAAYKPSTSNIQTLDNSPRRIIRNEFEDRETQGSFSRQPPSAGSKFSSEASDSPPKLPEKPSKANTISPPPLPPKKPNAAGLTGLKKSKKLQPNKENIYDVLPEPNERRVKEQKIYGYLGEIEQEEEEVAIEFLRELSQMSVMQLNQKIINGELPSELKGMTIAQIMEYVSTKLDSASVQETAPNNDNDNKEEEKDDENHDQFSGSEDRNDETLASQQQQSCQMKPSFSDNFVPVANESSKPESSTIDEEEIEKGHFTDADSVEDKSPQPSQATSTPSKRQHELNYCDIEEFTALSNIESRPITEDDILKKLQSMHQISLSKVPSTVSSTSIGGDSKGFEDSFVSHQNKSPAPNSQEDRYAVLRELQWEEDIIRAWKSDDEGPDVEEHPVKSSLEQENFESDKKEHISRPRLSSSEGSLVEGGNSGFNETPKSMSEASLPDNDVKSAKNYPAESRDVSSNAFESAFGSSSDSTVVSTRTDKWATFDEGPDESTQSGHISRLKRGQHSPLASQKSDDGFDSEKELSQYSSNRPSHKYNSLQTRGVVSSQDVPYYNSSRRSQKVSSDSDNPFGKDTFTPTILTSSAPRDVPVTPPVFEGRVQEVHGKTDSGSECCRSQEDVFVSDHLLDERGFKVRAAGNKVTSRTSGEDDEDDVETIPKSDSITIFGIKDDPFDDDFFKH